MLSLSFNKLRPALCPGDLSGVRCGWPEGCWPLAVGLAFVPNPMDDILAQRTAIREAAQKQAEAIQEARRDFEEATDPTAEERFPSSASSSWS
ncbi:MAG: hypothetical protein U0401_06095 [Anaerolineae bacterium]